MLNPNFVSRSLEEKQYDVYTSPVVQMKYAVAPKERNGHLPVVVIINNLGQYIDSSMDFVFFEQIVRNSHHVPSEDDVVLDFLYVVVSSEKIRLKGKNIILINASDGTLCQKRVQKGLQMEADLVAGILEYDNAFEEAWRGKYIGNVKHYRPWITMVLVAIQLVICLYTINDPARFGYSPEQVRNGSLIGIFTYMFVHANLIHLIGNMSSLYCIGSVLEEQIGAAKVLCLYLVSGLYGSIMDVIINASSTTVTVGASGAICGLLTALIVKTLMTPKKERHYRVSSLMKSVIIILFSGIMIKNINNVAHIGGMLAGIFFMIIFCQADKIEFYQKRIRASQIVNNSATSKIP